jgi:hypothetical protein
MNGQRQSRIAAALAAALSGLLAPWAIPPSAQPATSPSAAPATQRAPEDPDQEGAGLRAAFLSGAPDEIARAGQRLSATQTADALAGSDRELALAAASAAPWVADRIWLLLALGEAARSPDRPLAAAAARSAARIAGNLDGDQLLQRDVPADWVRARMAEYRAQAADVGRWTDVRVASLEVAAHLHRALVERAAPSEPAYDLAAVLADPEPELRRAALELTLGPLDADRRSLVAARVKSDEDPVVVAAASQALCEGLAFGEDAAPVLEALGRRGLTRMRALVADRDEPAPARAAAALCLHADGSAASRAALDRLDQDEIDGAQAPASEPERDDKKGKPDKPEPRRRKRREAK